MSGRHDKSQIVLFSYENIYSLYKEAQSGFQPKETPSAVVQKFKKNLNELQELQSRLHYMLKEIEELISYKK